MRLLLASPPSALSSIAFSTATSSRVSARCSRPLSLRPLSPLPRIKSNRMNDGDDLCLESSMPKPDASLPAAAAAAGKSSSSTTSGDAVVAPPPAGSKMNSVLFIETGFGCDGHGQDSTKAAVRAARNAIEFNSIPSIRRLVPGGYDNLMLHVKIGVPHPEKVDKARVAAVFPYGSCDVVVVEGGLSAGSGIAIASLGDSSDEMVIAVCAVTVGFFDKEKEKEKAEGGECDAPKHGGYCE